MGKRKKVTYKKPAGKRPPQPELTPQQLKKRWDHKRDAIHTLADNIDRLKRKVKSDLSSPIEKDQLTALVIRVMMLTSERVGNSKSADNGRFGITQLKKSHARVSGSTVTLTYTGKSGVQHKKTFSNAAAAKLIKKLKERKGEYLFKTEEGFRIKPDRVNRYLRNFDVKSKDIRGFNANRMVLTRLNQISVVRDEKERPKVFNSVLKVVAEKIGHGAPTLRKHYLLPEIEDTFYKKGSVRSIKSVA